MTETNCPQCNAPNPSQSKFCSRCGAPLGNDDTHICPACGTSNPLTLLYCDNCGTRLIDDTPPASADEDDVEESGRSEPFSLPARAPGQTGNLDVSSELPDWLKTGEFSTGAEETQDEPEGDGPDWLRAAQEGEDWEDDDAPTLEEVSEDHSPKDDLPTWLMDETTAGEFFDDERGTDELFMASLSPDDDDAPRETGSVLKGDLPAWLQGLSSAEVETAFDDDEDEPRSASQTEATEPDQREPPPEPQQQDDAVTELQGWLSDLEATDIDTSGPESSDRDPSMPQPSNKSETLAEPPQMEEDDFLRWLSEIQEDTADLSPEISSRADADPLQHTGLPDWLEQSSQESTLDTEEEEILGPDEDDVEGAEHEQALDWLNEPREDALSEPPADVPELMDMATPDWLTDHTASATHDAGDPEQDVDETAGKEAMPRSLSEEDTADASPEEKAGQVWPGDIAEGDDLEPQEKGTAEDAAAESIPEDEFLEWLDSLDDTSPAEVEDREEHAAEESFQEEPETTFAGDIDTEEQAGDIDEVDKVEELIQTDLTLPDWLGELKATEEPIADSDIAEIERLPDWLQDLAPPGADVTLPYVSGIEDDEASLAPDESEERADSVEEAVDLLEDLQGITPAESEDEVLLPDWLDGVTSELEDAEAPADTGEPAQSMADEQQRVADPLQDVGDERGATAFEPLALDEQVVSSEDLPDWFSDVLVDLEPEQESGDLSQLPPEMTNVPEQLAGTELPQWLDSPFSDETVAEPTPLEEIPEWLRAPLRERLARAAEERGLDESALESGDEWRELLESTPSESDETEGQRKESALAWLEALRTESASALADERQVSDEREADDSPFAGIPGAIAVAPVVARTARSDVVKTGVSGKAQEQQIMLLRQLARSDKEENSVSVIGSARAQATSLPLRLVLSILLMTTVILGRFASDLLPLPATNGGIQSVAAAMEDVLGAAQSQPTLLVFDYTPAMAGALHTPVANVVRALEGQGSPILVTSQSAAGLALAQGIFDDASLAVDDLGFIPGGSLGVRRLGRCLDAGATCQELFGQSLAPEVTGRLTDVALIIVITAERNNLITWVEQLNDIRSVSVAAIVTPALQPVAAPYLASGQIAALGIAMGASASNGSLWNSVTGPALLYAHWLVLIAMIAGAVYYLVAGALRSRRK